MYDMNGRMGSITDSDDDKDTNDDETYVACRDARLRRNRLASARLEAGGRRCRTDGRYARRSGTKGKLREG